jgi:3-oxoacyl-[acyl-carrier-protein] synthase III
VTDSGWDWFDPNNTPDDDASLDHWQACFADPAGAAVLAELERQILHSSLGPDATNSAIWMREGQRALVLQIRRLASGAKTES